MTRSELVTEFISIDSYPGKATFHVAKISWDGHTPNREWVKHSEVEGELTDTKKDTVISKILSDKKFFKICKECSEVNPVGWMHDSKICQSCAEKQGVVY